MEERMDDLENMFIIILESLKQIHERQEIDAMNVGAQQQYFGPVPYEKITIRSTDNTTSGDIDINGGVFHICDGTVDINSDYKTSNKILF